MINDVNWVPMPHRLCDSRNSSILTTAVLETVLGFWATSVNQSWNDGGLCKTSLFGKDFSFQILFFFNKSRFFIKNTIWEKKLKMDLSQIDLFFRIYYLIKIICNTVLFWWWLLFKNQIDLSVWVQFYKFVPLTPRSSSSRQ